MSIPGVVRVRCGVDWDALRVLPEPGQRALTALGSGAGPVLAGVYTDQWTFLIDRGSADQWDLRGRGVRLLRPNTVIELLLTAACAHTRDVRWVVPPGGWTDPHQLYRALSGTATPSAARKPSGRKKKSAVPKPGPAS